MSTVEYLIPGIHCGHCVHTIKMEISELVGVRSVEVSQDTKMLVVEFETPASEEQIEKVLVEINYPPHK